MLEYDFNQDLGYWIHMSAHRLECAVNAELMDEGITYRQCQILAILALKGNLSQVELAQQMRVQPPSIVMVIDRMEREGLIERKMDAQDRRKRIISPTQKAIPLWNRIVKCFKAVGEKSQGGLSPSDVETLMNLLQRVYANLDDQTAAAACQASSSADQKKKKTN